MTTTAVVNLTSRMLTNPCRIGTEGLYVCKERLYESIRAIPSNQVRAERFMPRRISWTTRALGVD